MQDSIFLLAKLHSINTRGQGKSSDFDLERRSEVVSIATSYSGGDILEFLQQIS
jgi:hypothetical protein